MTLPNIKDTLSPHDTGYCVGLLPMGSTRYGYSNPWKRSTREGKQFEQGKSEGERFRNTKGQEAALIEFAEYNK